MNRRPRPFDWRRAMAEAETRLAQPPLSSIVRRPEPEGDVVFRFAIELELCPTTNATRRKPNWWYSKHRDELYRRMLPQFLLCRHPRGKALFGRPQVLAVRFAPNPPDICGDWAKSAIDRLILPLRIRREGKLVDCRRFGIIEDDNQFAADVHQWWEPCPKALGCVYIQVRTGEKGAQGDVG
jgi:hypothetical protein